ncbi:MAG: tetratricopeptide repeat protein [Candidatus Altiarchaeota archaeon]
MVLKSIPGGERCVLSGFQELADYFRRTQSGGQVLEGVAEEKLGRMRDEISAAHDELASASKAPTPDASRPSFMRADAHAWTTLKISSGNQGLRSEDVKAVSPAEFAERMPNFEAPYVSQALTIIGVSYLNRSMNYDAVCFLERACTLDAGNTFALRNLVRACSAAGKQTLARDVGNWAEEVNRETTVGLDASHMLLGALGVTQAHLEGKAPMQEFQADSATTARVMFALNARASLLYKRGRFQAYNLHDARNGGETLGESIRHAQTSLALLGLPRAIGKAEQAIAVKKDDALVVEHVRDAAWAYTNIGNCRVLQERPEEARHAYHLALMLAPDYKLALDNLGKLPPEKTPERSVVEEAPAQPLVERAPTPWNQARQAIISKATVTVNFGEVSLNKCSNQEIAAHATALVEDVTALRQNPSLCIDFLAHARERQDEFWSGLEAGSLPEFSRLNQTLTHIAGDRDRYGANRAGEARALLRDYQSIHDTMLAPGLERDTQRIKELYEKITSS